MLVKNYLDEDWSLGTCITDYSEYINGCGKTHLNCGGTCSLSGNSGLYETEGS